VKSQRSNEKAFQEIVTAFGFRMMPNSIYTRCVLCNGAFREVPRTEYHTLMSVPEKIRGGKFSVPMLMANIHMLITTTR
jgi:uncharacterized protein with PIN domain